MANKKLPHGRIAMGLMTLVILFAACAAPDAATGPAETPAPTATRAPTDTPTPEPTDTPTETPIPPSATPDAVIESIVYAEPAVDTVDAQELDIYKPEGDPEDAPIVVFAHGFGQSKEAYQTLAEMLAAEGAVAFIPNWPSPIPSTATDWRRGAEAIACAVQYARAHGPEYGGDPDNIVLAGFSAGGAFAAHVAVSHESFEARWEVYETTSDGPPDQFTCTAEETASTVAALVGVGGAYSFVDRFATSDPELYEILVIPGESRDLDVRVMQGEFDSTVPPIVGQTFHELLLEGGYDAELILYDSGHTVPRELTVETIMEVADE